MQNNPSKFDKNQTKGFAGLQVVKRECVWMKAGVINFRTCDRDYDCQNCPFDRSMRSAMDAQHGAGEYSKETRWAEKMRRQYPGAWKPCRYYLTGDISSPGLCPRNYDCDGCPIELELGYRRISRSIEVARYAGELEGRASSEKTDGDAEKGRLPGFQVLDRECVWMKAGIVAFRLCDGDYDCRHCDFDRSMREAMAEQQAPRAQERPKGAPGGRPGLIVSPCIHHLAGRREAPAACSRGYDCYRCPVHESVGMSVQVRPASRPHSPVRHASGYKVADDYYYHFGHTWVRIIHGECVKVGVDDFAGRLFGTADAFEVLETGMSMKQAEVGLSLIRGNNQAPVLSPLSGKVLAINQKVLEHPEVLIEDPYQDGWLFQLEPYWLKWEAQGLFHGEECLDWMEQEHRRLLQLMGPGHENLASTGGEPVTDVIGHFPDLGWDRLVLSFLRTGPKADQD